MGRFVVFAALLLVACSSDDAGGLDAAAGADAGSADATLRDATLSDAKTDAYAPPTCAGVTCADAGSCFLDDAGLAECKCKNGYVASGATCIPDPCKTFSCPGRCAQCIVVNGAPTCGCGAGWKSNGMGGCTPDPSPCEPDPCAADQVCVAEIHCQKSGACLQGCDCSNCGNCDNIATNTNCGGTDDAGRPTVACKSPCGPGEGCIPTGGSPWGMCYPAEGCFSR